MKEWIDRHFEEQVTLLKTLAAIPSPSHQEDLRVAFLREWLRKEGFDSAYTDPAKNVVLPFGQEKEGGITVYMAHTDIVFPDLTPLPVRMEDGKMFAPGVGDDTANAVGLLMTLRYIREHGLKAKEPVLIVFNSCEEGLGNLKGVRQIMADYGPRIRELISFDGSWKRMICRAVGSERWKVKASTVGGHSYSAFGNPNAIHHLSLLIARLYEQPLPDWPDQKTTYNVGVISGGTTVNSIAQSAEMLYEYRSDDRKALAMMREQFFRAVSEAGCEKAHFETELLGERPCSGDPDPEAMEKLLARCEKAIRKINGDQPVPRGSASTDANIPLSLGIPAATFGLYLGGKAHTREEWLDIESLRTGLPIAIELITSHFA